jgi:hypothetical protein
MTVPARSPAQQRKDSLSNILRGNLSDFDKQQQLKNLIFDRLMLSSAYDHTQKSFGDSLRRYPMAGGAELEMLANIFILRRNFELEAAERLLMSAIELAQGHQEKYLLYQFYTNLAYVQTDQNEVPAAIYNYRQAKRVAAELANSKLLLIIDIGISDIYTKIGLYQQALIYLNEAQQELRGLAIDDSTSSTLINLNKAEIFFRLGKVDSLLYYQQQTSRYGAGTDDLDRNLKRLSYYTLLLRRQYPKAIVLIRELLTTGNRYYKNVDRWYLAKSLHAIKKLDSAAMEAHSILSEEVKGPSTIRLDAYKLIATVAEDQRDQKKAQRYYKLALAESELFSLKMRSVDQLSTELRQDRLDAAYQAQQLLFRKERHVLFASIAVTILIILVIYLFYRNVKQKSSYQKLLHDTRSQELAFINSHQVRKPLANILAVCSLLKDVDNTREENVIYYEMLDQQVKEMDQKLREVEMKLREHR